MHQIASGTFTERCAPGLFAYCPTMDLIATAKERGRVDVSRLSGQRVFGATFERDDDHDADADADRENQRGQGVSVKALGWRRDGQILAVACADGTVSLINAFTGKIAHRLSTRPRPRDAVSPSASFTSSPSRSQAAIQRTSPRSVPKSSQTSSLFTEARPPTVSCIAWTTHLTYPSPATIRSRLDHADSHVTLDHILGLRADVDKLLQFKADLPRELSAIDFEVSLPKLATLPPRGVGIDDDLFSSRASVDAVFHGAGSTGSGASGAGGVDALLVGLQGEYGNDDGVCAVHLRIFDSFEVGVVHVGGCLPLGSRRAKVVRMESHPFLSTVFVVVEQSNADGDASSLHLLNMDLSFIPHTGRNLPSVARKAIQLGNLLRYISQVQTQLAAEIKAAFDLPTKFLRNINEALAEGDIHTDFVNVAHRLAVTGVCNPRLKEWLVDEVGDRGLKRWEKAVGDGLDVVRRMMSECLGPALERCLVVLSRLDGLAKFGPTSSRLGVDEKMVRGVRETLDVLVLVSGDLLRDVGTEIKGFAAFMKWLKWEYEVESLEEGSERQNELRESWTGEAELRTVLDYVRGAMKESRVRRHLTREAEEQESGLISEEPDVGFFADFKKKRASKDKDKKMPTLGQLVERLQRQCDGVFAQIAETFRKSILATYMLELPPRCLVENMSVRIIADEDDPNLHRLFILSQDRQEKGLLRQSMVVLRQGGKDLKSTTSSNSTTTLPHAKAILDAKFVDDESFLVLVSTGDDVRIYSRQLTPSLQSDEEVAWEVQHIFDQGRMEAGMKPARLEVNGRAGRRVVAVVDEAGMGYVVLDLDAGSNVLQDDGAGDEIMTG